MSRCAALDQIDDQSSDEERREYFREIDKDQSDGVDFEEFLEVRLSSIQHYIQLILFCIIQLIVKVNQEEGDGGCLSKLCKSTQLGIQVVFRITQLLPQEQMKHGLF